MSDIRRPNRYNTASGEARPGPDTKETGARLVAKVMAREYAKDQRAPGFSDTSTGKPGRFVIEDGNHAKKINHDAMPK